MTSLKKEIEDLLWNGEDYHKYELAEAILEIIEKRIDSILKSENFDYHNSTIYEDGFTDAIEKIKELLKC